MIQRSRARLALLALAAAATAAGCATFDQNEVVVKAGDRELTNDEFRSLAVDAGAEGGAERASRDQVDQIVFMFVTDTLLRADLADLGVDVPEVDVPADATAFGALQAESDTAIQTYLSQPIESLIDDAVRSTYAAGPDASGIVCPSHILVESETAAQEAIADIEGGASFADVAAGVSTDPGSAANGGSLGCFGVAQFEQTFIPEFVTAALDAEVGRVTDPIESQFGFHVILLPELDDLGEDDLATLVPLVRFAGLADRYGVAVDPRYGEWRAAQLQPVS